MKKFLIPFIVLSLVLAGCKTTDTPVITTNPTPLEIYNSTGWQANVVTELAFDIRGDGDVDYVWPEDVPVAIREKLERRAFELQPDWDGE